MIVVAVTASTVTAIGTAQALSFLTPQLVSWSTNIIKFEVQIDAPKTIDFIRIPENEIPFEEIVNKVKELCDPQNVEGLMRDAWKKVKEYQIQIEIQNKIYKFSKKIADFLKHIIEGKDNEDRIRRLKDSYQKDLLEELVCSLLNSIFTDDVAKYCGIPEWKNVESPMVATMSGTSSSLLFLKE